jgi:hypothetical protein
MIELRNAQQLEKATARAKASRLLVQSSGIFRMYYVTNRENQKRYTVRFIVSDGCRFGCCSCPAGERNILCKHLSAAAGLHTCLAAERLAA